MKKYIDFHTKDKAIDPAIDNVAYCTQRDELKEKEWCPFLTFPATKLCNFKCMYCGFGGETTASEKDCVSLDMIKEYVEIATKLGITKIRISGGEPFLHPQIDEILKYLSETGLYVLVNTNGSQIIKNKSVIDALNTNVMFAVSFDTLKEDVLKDISNVKCHSDIINGIKYLNAHGNLLRLNMVYSQKNKTEVFEIIKFCQELGCDLKILDIVSVPAPFSQERQNFYSEVNSLEKEFLDRCDEVYSHEYSRRFGTPCFRYRFGDVFVTVKNSKKGAHYDVSSADALCKRCPWYPCHEGLYDIFALPDGRLCSCRWTEEQKFDTPEAQMQYLITLFQRSRFVPTGYNDDMKSRADLLNKFH